MINVAIVEDQTLVREGFIRLLEFSEEIQVIGQAANGRDALALMENIEPDLLLVDIQMPELDGFGFIRALKQKALPNAMGNGQPKIIVLTTFGESDYIQQAICVGADGFLLKDVSFDELVSAIKRVMAGEKLLPKLAPAAASQPTSETGPLNELTPREREIFLKLAEGLSNKEIARQFSLSEGTIKNHVSNILAKLGVRDRTQAVVKFGEFILSASLS